MMPNNLISRIIMSVNRALLGQAFPCLVAIECKVYEEKKFEIVFILSTPPQDDDIEVMSCIETEVIADFEADYIISHSALVSSSEELRQFDSLIFLREKKAP